MGDDKKVDKKAEELSRISSETVEIKKAEIHSRDVERLCEMQLRSAKVVDAKDKVATSQQKTSDKDSK
jgi:hypothetical protein